MKQDTKISNYCKFDSQGLTFFTSSLYIAGLITSFSASFVAKIHGCKLCVLLAGAVFLAGSALRVGPGGSPDDNVETTIDALVMEGDVCQVTMEVGAVAAMRRVKDGIKAAILVMRHTEHNLLVGDKASAFAISMGLPEPSNLSSPEFIDKWKKWKANSWQPKFWKSVSPLDRSGPYHPKGMENTCRLGTLLWVHQRMEQPSKSPAGSAMDPLLGLEHMQMMKTVLAGPQWMVTS